MSYRCINAFEFANRIYPGGVLIEDDDAILKSHLDFFAKVEEPSALNTEFASAAPGEKRAVEPAKKAPAKKAAPKPPVKSDKPEGDN